MFSLQLFCVLCIFLHNCEATIIHPPIVTGAATHGQCVLLDQGYPGLIGEIFDESSKDSCDTIQHFPPDMVCCFKTCCNSNGTFYGCCPDACPAGLQECPPEGKQIK